jgi:hypothetical protein
MILQYFPGNTEENYERLHSGKQEANLFWIPPEYYHYMILNVCF